jgi:hypothetical protein
VQEVPPRHEDDPEDERLFRDLRNDETQREEVIESLKADIARLGWEAAGALRCDWGSVFFLCEGTREVLQSN